MTRMLLVWCPTDKLVGDFFSTPLSGSKFIDFRCRIMNTTRLDTLVKMATCLHQTSIMNSESKGRHRCEIKKEINTISSTEQGLVDLEYKIPEKMDIKNAFVYAALDSNGKTMKIFKDSDWAIYKSKDHKDCKKLNTANRKTKGYLDGSKPLIDQRANELKRVNFYKVHNPPIKEETS